MNSETELVLDSDVKAVAEFMQQRIAANRLVTVAEGVAALARILWGGFPQEPCRALDLRVPKLDLEHPLRSISIESSLAKSCADDGSAVGGSAR